MAARYRPGPAPSPDIVRLPVKCVTCSSWTWCGRPCASAPRITRLTPQPPRDPALAAFLERARGAEPASDDKARLLEHVPDALPYQRQTPSALFDQPAQPAPPPAPATQQHRRPGRPPSGKVRVTLLIEPNVLDAFKATGPGWQTRINAVLKAAVADKL